MQANANAKVQNHLDISVASLPQYDKVSVIARIAKRFVAIHNTKIKDIDCHDSASAESRNDDSAVDLL